MKAEYRRDMNHNYLILHENTELDTSSYQVRMLVGNKIPKLLKCQFHGVDGKVMFHYDITSKQSLAVLYENKLFKEADLRLIFLSFVQVMEQMGEYLLNPGQVLLQPEYLYMDVNKNEIYFCYLPGKEREIKEQFRMLTEYVLPKIDHSDEKAVILGYGVYRWALEDNFHLEHVKEELFRDCTNKEENLERFPGSVKQRRISENAGLSREKDKEEIEYMENALEALFDLEKEEVQVKKSSMIDNHKLNRKKNEKKQNQLSQKIYILVPVIGTIMIMAILAANMMGILPWLEVEILLITVVLVAMFISFLCFFIGKLHEKKQKEENDREWKEKVRQSKKMEEDFIEYKENNIQELIPASENENNEETVVLSASVIRGPATMVSKEPGELATIYLKDDLTVIGKLETAVDAVIPIPTISRLHAKVRKKGEDYYLADLNSRNGTSVNGRMLKVNEEYLLQDEDEVDFAEARYIFLK